MNKRKEKWKKEKAKYPSHTKISFLNTSQSVRWIFSSFKAAMGVVGLRGREQGKKKEKKKEKMKRETPNKNPARKTNLPQSNC
jgi:hypothetical protein